MVKFIRVRYTVNLVMLIVTMVKFIMAKPIMSQLVMVKSIMLN
jgi:hypothetical protein